MVKYIIAGLAALLMSAGLATAQEPARGMNLGGVGTVKAKPDEAYVTLEVVSEGKTAADATHENSKTMRKLCDAVEGFKIDAKDIQTTGFVVHPKYKYVKDEEPRAVGYLVSNSLVVHVRNLDVLGKLLDSAIVSGANRVQGVRWDVSNRTQLMDAARKAAFKDALRKANLYAEAGNFVLGDIKNVSEHDDYRDEGEGGGAYLRSMAAESAGPGGRPPVGTRGGEIVIRVRVNVHWEIACSR